MWKRWLVQFGLNPDLFIPALRSLRAYVCDYWALKSQVGTEWPLRVSYPCLLDRYEQSGTAQGHYFHQDFYVAREIFERKPARHVDVGSRIDGFVTHVASFREIEVMDLRPLSTKLHNVRFVQGDATDTASVPKGYCDSLSCLHAIEHFGLGRYGDRVDADGWLKGLMCLAQMLVPRGMLYLSTPVGRERIEFNAHRVFSINRILAAAERLGFLLERFSYIDDAGEFHEGHVLSDEDRKRNLGLDYGCGIFEFRKLPRTSE